MPTTAQIQAKSRAGKISGKKRRAEATRKRDLEAQQAEYPNEHDRGEHDEFALVGCPLCADRVKAALGIDEGGE